MKTLLSLLGLLFTISSIAQVHGGKEVYAKLFDLYAFEKYEDCAYKAERMTLNDKYRRDPEPYLYLAMCYYEINFMDSADLDQEYKDPIKESLKYAYKYIKKDKKMEIYAQNAEFFDKLKSHSLLRVKSHAEREEYRKAASEISRITKIDPENENLKFAQGVYQVLSRNTQGALLIKNALPAVEKNYKNPDYEVDQITEPTLIASLLTYSDALMSGGDKDSAKAIITIAKDIFQENEKITEEYNILHNIKTAKKENERPDEINGVKMIYEKHESDDMNEEEKEESDAPKEMKKDQKNDQSSTNSGEPEMKSN
ncbi:MAG: hypothetical protein MRY83_24545 [Flavobacteriales bacterium]|nr:hypothetical protein [Flavobacteriales bacterium]